MRVETAAPPASASREAPGPEPTPRPLRFARVWLSLFFHLLVRDLRVRHRAAFLGEAWALLRPLFLLGVYSFVFTFILGVRLLPADAAGADHPDARSVLALFAGLLPWLAVQESLLRGATAFVDAQAIVAYVRCPRSVVPLIPAGTCAVDQAVGTLLLLIGTMIWSGPPQGAWLLLVPMMALQGAMVAGLALLLSCAYLFVRDTIHVLRVALMTAMFASPIFWPEWRVPAGWEWLVRGNPFAALLRVYRALLFAPETLSGTDVWIMTVTAAVLLGAGIATYRALRRKMFDLL